MVYADEIEMYNGYNDDDKVYGVENDIERRMMDDQAMVVDIALLFGEDRARNDVEVALVNV